MKVSKILRLSQCTLLVIISACIGTDIIDDFVEARASLIKPLSVLLVGDTYQYQAQFFDNTGVAQMAVFEWLSSDPSVIEINQEGMALALSPGTTVISCSANGTTDAISVEVFDPAAVDEDSIRMAQQKMQNPERTAILQTVSSYRLEGTATLREGNGIQLILSEDFRTSSSLPGLYLYLTNNVNTTNNALEIGAVLEFSGAQIYQVPGNIQLQDYSHVLFYCKPFVVPVGNGKFEP